ncbi:hypothetical protein IG631_04478 [Alternaria alternata]|nr:hypothetical protein IG631_04478 [Alternaria alternata]
MVVNCNNRSSNSDQPLVTDASRLESLDYDSRCRVKVVTHSGDRCPPSKTAPWLHCQLQLAYLLHMSSVKNLAFWQAIHDFRIINDTPPRMREFHKPK